LQWPDIQEFPQRPAGSPLHDWARLADACAIFAQPSKRYVGPKCVGAVAGHVAAESAGATESGGGEEISARRIALPPISGNKKAGSAKTRLSLLEVPIKAKPPEGNTPRR
jgi:hypothetical protein